MKTVIEMALLAGFSVKNFKPPVITARHSNGSWVSIGENLECFADLVRADEREACAEIDFYELLRSVCSKEQAEEYADLISTAIKARGDK